MGARYAANEESSPLVIAPKDQKGGGKNEVKQKFRELVQKNKKKQCNYEEVHALYKT